MVSINGQLKVVNSGPYSLESTQTKGMMPLKMMFRERSR